jgi:hypothetical protein
MLVPAASATTITFGTGGTSGFTTGGASSVTVNDAAGVTGLTVTVTASATTACPACVISAQVGGYGVTSVVGDNAEIDGNGLIDTLIVSFSRDVTVTGATFSSFQGNDNGEFYNTTTGSLLVSAFGSSSIAVNTTGTSFTFLAPGTGDDYFLQTLTFNVVSPTPEPATLGMMGIALLGIGFGARKRIKRG